MGKKKDVKHQQYLQVYNHLIRKNVKTCSFINPHIHLIIHSWTNANKKNLYKRKEIPRIRICREKSELRGKGERKEERAVSLASEDRPPPPTETLPISSENPLGLLRTVKRSFETAFFLPAPALHWKLFDRLPLSEKSGLMFFSQKNPSYGVVLLMFWLGYPDGQDDLPLDLTWALAQPHTLSCALLTKMDFQYEFSARNLFKNLSSFHDSIIIEIFNFVLIIPRQLGLELTRISFTIVGSLHYHLSHSSRVLAASSSCLNSQNFLKSLSTSQKSLFISHQINLVVLGLLCKKKNKKNI